MLLGIICVAETAALCRNILDSWAAELSALDAADRDDEAGMSGLESHHMAAPAVPHPLESVGLRALQDERGWAGPLGEDL